MGSYKKEWRVSQISRDELNDALYQGIDPLINSHISHPATASKAYDAKLITRELVDNIYKHDSAFSINVEISVTGTMFKAVIKHNGTAFDPFADDSPCKLIKKIQYDIGFRPSFSPTDAGKRVITISFDMA